MGYSLYIGGLWAYQVHGTEWFLILSGAILGFSELLAFGHEISHDLIPISCCSPLVCSGLYHDVLP
jgi:hypothetical protein